MSYSVGWEYKMVQAALEIIVAIPQNVYPRVTIGSSGSAPKRVENMSTQKLVHECL